MIDLDKVRETFFAECEDHVAAMESSILELEENPGDGELLNCIFRAAHSIKGNSGCLGFQQIYSFTHTMETLLERLRSGEMEVSGDITSLLLESVDCIKVLVDAAREGNGCAETVGDTLKRLEALLSEDGGAQAGRDRTPCPQTRTPSGAARYRIVFEPGRELLKRGMDPLKILQELSTLGRLVKVEPDLSRLPGIHELDPELCYLSWEILLESDVDESVLQGVFDFVRDESRVEITRVDPCGAVETEGEDTGLSVQPVPADAGKVRKDAGTAGGRERKASQSSESTTIRVDTEKVDKLVNLVGELLITQSMVSQLTSELVQNRSNPLFNAVAQLERNTMEIQETVMSVRMLPVGSVFNRFKRLVRDLAVAREKKVRLMIEGEDTELDKTVIEMLVDPLTHLLRNCVDHGIEAPEVRRAAGKPEEGTIRLTAFHEGGKVIITVEDDGRGIDRDAVLKKAVEKGLVEDGAALSDREVYSLILMPGFSTAERITDVSGRGVGMDVVKRNIEGMGGSVTIETEKGSFTRFVLKLPLTLAIIEGLTVSVGGEKFIIPITTVLESKRPSRSEVKTVESEGEVMNFRGSYVPIIRLHRLFGLKGARHTPWEALVVVVSVDGKEYGLLVDELLGEQQVVIKGLGSLQGVPGIAGATILGDGRVALILDGAGIIKRGLGL